MNLIESVKLHEHLQRKEFIKVMKGSHYGWKPLKGYEHVGCPSDLYFVSEGDEPYKGNCFMDCEDCWKYVLKNKKW